MNTWINIKDDMPPFPPHTQDGATERVLIYIKKHYHPKIYTAFADYSEDGVCWFIDGFSKSSTEVWEITHWQLLPEEPKET